jgi:hypothetical protein
VFPAVRGQGCGHDAEHERLGDDAVKVHAVRMPESSNYAVTLDELVATARVPLDDQLEVQDDSERRDHDEAAGHLPGNIRPWAL